ncbi:hypothetical protein [Dysosmobacter sp.]
MYVMNTPSQMHAIELAEREHPLASTLYASMLSVCYNFGVAAGPFLGSAVQGSWGLELPGLPAPVFALLALIMNRRLLCAAAWAAA